jgi:poly-beta-1,6-N-acetyl-D-glucosamine synthase
MVFGLSLPVTQALWVTFVLSSPVFVYLYLILGFSKGWKQPRDTVNQSNGVVTPFISVIIPFRNEQDTLHELLHGLSSQTLSSKLFEVVFVDDHSTDNSLAILKNRPLSENIQILSSNGKGKKAALATGIEAASGELIVTTDADIEPSTKWLKGISDFYSKTPASMLIGAVKMNADTTFLSKFQSIDFFALQMSSSGAAMSGHPVFCSGANLIFKKSVWASVRDKQAGRHHASGDDVFLLHAFKKYGEEIHFLHNSDCIVTVQPEATWKKFFRQRMRWGGKSSSYRDKDSIVLALTVLYTNLLITCLFVASFFQLWLCMFYIMIMLSKGTIDLILLKRGQKFFRMNFTMFEYICYSLVYPFLLVFNAIGGLLFTSKWKK